MSVNAPAILAVIGTLLSVYTLGARRRIDKYGKSDGSGSLVGVLATPVLAFCAAIGALGCFVLSAVFYFG